MTNRRLAVAAAAVCAAAPLLAGCGDAGGLRSAGATPTAVGPERLWPSLPPASRAADDYGAGETAVIKGVDVPDGNLREVDPVAVVRARVSADPEDYKDIVDAVADCGAPGRRTAACPVLKAYYRDLSGDGEDDLLVAVRAPKRQLYTQVYTYTGGKLIQIMDDKDAVINVQLAGRNVVVRSAADLPGYEYRTSWSYDTHQKAILPTRDEIIRTGPPRTPAPDASPTPSVTPTVSPRPSRTPSPSRS
ncbi:hypothetical protein V2W30_26775 [Streptomyces sp. Q6]|uniref:Uncharacterized protein n=1 Tax=Streptomyces citrinus TaxID=3118173 RepID=A0ACD5AHM6_9ACTN